MTPIISKRSKTILTVSEFSKREIVERLGISQEKIIVAYNGISDCFNCVMEDNKKIAKKVSGQYILTVSSLDPRKNILLVLKAFQLMDTDLPLYIIGEKNTVFGKLELPDIISNVHFLGRLSDMQLVDYYAHAALFVYPSLYEGFGLPPLEALVCGCKNVLVSDIPVFHEIYGSHVSYVRCSSAKEFATAMDSALKYPPSKTCVNALKQKFDWAKTARKIANVISLSQ